jgi:subtilisin family serine protease
MKQQARALLLAAVSVLAACQDATTPLQPAADHPQALIGLPGIGLPGIPQLGVSRYIVVFRNDVADPLGLSRVLVATHGGRLLHTYQRALKGFAAFLPNVAVATLRLNPLVAYVESDRTVRTSDTQTMDASGDPWGLDRIDQQAKPLSGTYTYTSSGAGVHAYIIDTGIWTLHPDFGGRADNVYDALTFGLIVIGLDCNGHGTHVAGTVGGATYGVAKEVQLHGVRVLGCAGVGFDSDVIAGVDWVAANHESPAVANMSLGGDFSRALNDAVTELSNTGVFMAVAAGNDDADACGASPASAAGAFTVAASDRTDAKSSFSNWGTCVEAYAPGSAVRSAWLLGATMTFSGTSMASPHVAGTAALYKATFGDAPSGTVAAWITSNATTGVITGNPGGTPNRLLYKSDL